MKFKTDSNIIGKILKKGPARWAFLVFAIILSVALKFYFTVAPSVYNPHLVELKDEWLKCQSSEDCVSVYNGCDDVAVNKTHALEAHRFFINLHTLDRSKCKVDSTRTLLVSCQNNLCTGNY